VWSEAVEKVGRRKKRAEDEDDEAQDEGPQMDNTTSTVTVSLPTNQPSTAASTTTALEPDTKRAKLDNQ